MPPVGQRACTTERPAYQQMAADALQECGQTVKHLCIPSSGDRWNHKHSLWGLVKLQGQSVQ